MERSKTVEKVYSRGISVSTGTGALASHGSSFLKNVRAGCWVSSFLRRVSRASRMASGRDVYKRQIYAWSHQRAPQQGADRSFLPGGASRACGCLDRNGGNLSLIHILGKVGVTVVLGMVGVPLPVETLFPGPV